MATMDDKLAELYNKVNACSISLAEMTARVNATNAHMERMFQVIENQNQRINRIMYGLFTLLLICIGAIIIGAIGKSGWYSVRNGVAWSPSREAIVCQTDSHKEWMATKESLLNIKEKII